MGSELIGTNNDALRVELRELNKQFSYLDFFGMTSENGILGAVAILTPSQYITIMNENNGKGLWTDSETRIVQAIYDISQDNKELFGDKCKEYIENSIVFEMSVWRNRLSIQVRFPERLLPGHLNILSEYIERYGSDIDQIAMDYKKRSNSALINIDRGELRDELGVISAMDIMREATLRVPGDMVVTENPPEDPYTIGFVSKSFTGLLAAQSLAGSKPTLLECTGVGVNMHVLGTDIGGKFDGK